MSYSRIVLIFLAGVVAFRIGAAFYTAGNTELTVWGDRDLWRALTLGSSWPVSGPEINGGLRPPGGAFYLLLGTILAIHPSVLAANIGVFVLFAASLLLLGLMMAREMTPRVGILAAVALAGAPMLAEVLTVWNPGFLLFFATVATLFGYRFLKTGEVLPLGIAAAAVAIGLQIHLQIFQLAVALVAAALIQRPSWTWRHVLALALGLGLPFLPVALGGDYHFIASAVPVFGGAVDNYVLWEFHPLEKAQLVYGLLGGTVASPDFEPNGITILAMIGDLLAALLVLGFFGWAIKSIGHSRESGNVHTGRPFGVFALIAVVYLVVGLVSTVNARHMVAAWPAIAIMTGAAADAVLRRLGSARHPRLAGAGCALLLCGMALRPLALGVASLHEDAFSLGSVAAQSEIAATVKSAFYADHEAFDAHAALFWRPGSRAWQLVQEGVSGQMTFVYQSTPATSVKSDSEACLAIVEKEDMTGDPRAELVKSPPFSGLAPVFAPMAAESPHFAYFPYTTADGNCLKSFPNAYISTQFEAAFLSPGGTTTPATQTSDAAQFVGFLPGRTFPIGLELRRSGSDYRAILHGRLLRGYTGLRFATIVNPTLCLVSNAGVRVIPVGRLPIGSPQRGSLTPWQSPLFALPDGTYHLWLVGRDGWTPQAVQIALGLVVLPNMQVGVPEAVSAAPPVGCPVPIPGSS